MLIIWFRTAAGGSLPAAPCGSPVSYFWLVLLVASEAFFVVEAFFIA